jgi:hypothetical protein
LRLRLLRALPGLSLLLFGKLAEIVFQLFLRAERSQGLLGFRVSRASSAADTLRCANRRAGTTGDGCDDECGRDDEEKNDADLGFHRPASFGYGIRVAATWNGGSAEKLHAE